MSALQREITQFIKIMPDSQLQVLKPLLEFLTGNDFVVETDLTPAERAIIAKGREEYKKGTYIRRKRA